MPISALQAAKYLCELGDWSDTNLELQKKIYIPHMVFLGRNEGRRLIDESFEAWDYGPVIPSLYHTLKSYGAGPVGNVFRLVPEIEDESALEYLDWAHKELKDFSASRLVAITHWKEGAWSKVYKPGEFGLTIPDEYIKAEYSARFSS